MWYDLVTLAILAFAVIRGSFKGFIWQVAWIAALVLAFLFAETASIAAAPYIDIDPPLNRWIAMLVLYVIFSFLCFAVARMLRDWIEKARLVEYDRHLGMLFGLFKGALFSLVLTFFLVTLAPEPTRDDVLHSQSGYLAAIVLNRLEPVMPAELHRILDPYLREFEAAPAKNGVGNVPAD